MILTSAIKGQLTKAVKAVNANTPQPAGHLYRKVRIIFEKIMPREQAKHATRKYLDGIVA